MLLRDAAEARDLRRPGLGDSRVCPDHLHADHEGRRAGRLRDDRDRALLLLFGAVSDPRHHRRLSVRAVRGDQGPSDLYCGGE